MPDIKTNRLYGYDLLINTFESSLREFLISLFISNYGNTWKKHIPEGVLLDLEDIKKIEIEDITAINDFFEELNFLHLKDIIIYSDHYKLSKPFFADLNKERFIEIMNDLNILRRKIAHVKSSFSEQDLSELIESIKIVTQGEKANEVKKYIENEEYKNANEIPLDFYEEYECQNNLPSEDYDLDGGFVGRDKEIKTLKKLINSEQDRIITITGAGGVGKTAIALKLGYNYLADISNPFEAIIWFSAKTNKLTDQGIIDLTSSIRDDEQLIRDILKIIDPKSYQLFLGASIPLEGYKNHLNNLFSSHRCLLIIDNLETILKNDDIIDFIREIPRPSQVLITSRKGMGELERRVPISDMPQKDAIRLFRLVAKERNRMDLVRLSDDHISGLVNRVKCYPLLIKWSIGQVCLGKSPDESFSQIFEGESEIAKFSFDDVFKLLSANSKTLLYSMIIFGKESVSKYVLMHLSNLNDDDFEDSIKDLIMTSFIMPEIRETEKELVTEYSMLALTRGYIEKKLDQDEKIKSMLSTRLFHLTSELEEFEKSKTIYSQSLFSLGIKSADEKVAFNYVKAAKNFVKNNDFDNAEKNFEQAMKIAPSFSYAYTEYSKFESLRKHPQKGLELAGKALEVDPDNYHVWFNYGIFLRKNGQIPEAVKIFQRAKELNPNHLPIYNELGRSFTLLGEFEKAELEFSSALKEEKYPNYRHKIMTLQFKADNYYRMAQAFRMRRDSDNQIENLRKSYDTILEALEIDRTDKYLWKFYRRISKEFGIALSIERGFDEGKPFLEKSIQVIHLDKRDFIPDGKIVSEACFYLAAFSLNAKSTDVIQIRSWIDQGLKNCQIGSMQYEKLMGLLQQMDTQDERNTDERFWGIIDYYNIPRKYGIVKSDKESYLFFLSGFRERISQDSLKNFQGKRVTFSVRRGTKENRLIAVDIIFE